MFKASLAYSLAMPRQLPGFTAVADVVQLPKKASCGLVGSALEREAEAVI
jgi:hypothetical protein